MAHSSHQALQHTGLNQSPRRQCLRRQLDGGGGGGFQIHLWLGNSPEIRDGVEIVGGPRSCLDGPGGRQVLPALILYFLGAVRRRAILHEQDLAWIWHQRTLQN